MMLTRWINVLLGWVFGVEASGDPRAWLFTHDLNKGERRRKGWWHGRASLHLHGRKNTSFRLEWVVGDLWNLSFSMALRSDYENTLTWHVCVPLLSLYCGVEGPQWLRNLARWLCRHEKYEHEMQREISLRVFDNKVWFTLWMNPDSWSSKEPRWRRFTFDPESIVFGAKRYSEENARTMQVLVPMPEGAYPATLTMFDGVWRDRFRRLVIARAQVDIPGGIPFEGKGENSWDCGEDATYGMTTPAELPEEAIAAVVKSVMRERRKHSSGGLMAEYPAPSVRLERLAALKASQPDNGPVSA